MACRVRFSEERRESRPKIYSIERNRSQPFLSDRYSKYNSTLTQRCPESFIVPPSLVEHAVRGGADRAGVVVEKTRWRGRKWKGQIL